MKACKILAAWWALVLAVGCASSPPHAPVPEHLVNEATVAGIENLRYWGDALPANIEALSAQRVEQLSERFSAQAKAGETPTLSYLALSGGGANGAFSAGLLKGWTESGTRPEFEVVTGISAGALTAPFAFLGPEYDQLLEEAYTRTTDEDIYKVTKWAGLSGGPALTDSGPLAAIIARLVDQDLLDKIAAEHRRGRMLLLGTANLDARRPVIWDIGVLADSGHPEAVDLLRRIMLASAAVPGAFPPVLFDVEAQGRRYDEVHVDGGIAGKVFFYPPQLAARRHMTQLDIPLNRVLYVVRNGRINPSYLPVETDVYSIALQSLSTMSTAHGIGDLYRLYAVAKRDGFDFNVAYIPDDFDLQSEGAFDPIYMRALFDRGYEMILRDDFWYKSPPGLDP